MEPLGKKAAGEKAAQMIKDGMKVGLGTGSTAKYFIEALSKKVREGLLIECASSSKASLDLAKKLQIPILQPDQIETLDVTVDGADEIDPIKNMIKGGGGALFREKILAHASKEMIVIVDEKKFVDKLGTFPLPVEISPFGFKATLKSLLNLSLGGAIRKTSEGTYFITDEGNYLFDFAPIKTLVLDEDFDSKLKKIPGVIETGLFLGYAGKVVVGFEDGRTEVR